MKTVISSLTHDEVCIAIEEYIKKNLIDDELQHQIIIEIKFVSLTPISWEPHEIAAKYTYEIDE